MYLPASDPRLCALFHSSPSQTPAGRQQIQTTLGLCSPLNTVDDVTQVAWWLLNAWDTM
jgi:hypothetical protein